MPIVLITYASGKSFTWLWLQGYGVLQTYNTKLRIFKTIYIFNFIDDSKI